MTLDEIMVARRSIRHYKPDAVNADALRQVLEAGRLAPSARNRQNWHFTVVQSEADRERMEKACSNQAMLREAPHNLVVWADDALMMACGHSAAVVDCSIALSFMMLKATELGLGSCWLGSFLAPQVKELLALPEDAAVVALLVLGYPAEEPAPRPRKALDEVFEIR